MPRGGRPESIEVARWGKLVLSRPDALNWMLDGDGRTTYHVTLPTALLAATYRVADKEHRRDINKWLEKFSQMVSQIVKLFPAIELKGCLPVKKGVR